MRCISLAVAVIFLACSSSSSSGEGGGGGNDAGVEPETGPTNEGGVVTSDTPYSLGVGGDGPLLYWRVDETSGAKAADFTTNALDGTYSATDIERAQPSLVGDVNRAIRITPGGSIDGPNDAKLGFAGTAAFTVEVWISFPAPPVAIQTIIARSSDTDTTGWQMWVDPQGGALRAFFGRYENGTGVTVATDAATAIAVGETYHLVAVYDGANVGIHLNGVAKEQKPSTTPLTDKNYKLRVGRGEDGDAVLNARIDEIAVYAKALPADRIKAHYDVGITKQ